MAQKKTQKKHKNNYGIWIFVLVVLIGYNLYLIYVNYFKLNNSEKAMYNSFDITTPANYAIHGIDVSQYQSTIYWPLVKNMKVQNLQLSFAFIRATRGINLIDEQYQTNKTKANQIGLTVGAYHYFFPNLNGVQQAQHFIHHAQLKSGDLPPVVDVENFHGATVQQMQQQLMACLQTLEATYKVKPIIYSNVSFYQNYLGSAFNIYPLWVAHYFAPEGPRITRPFLFWQHTDKGRVNGIVTRVDFNVFNGDESAFNELLLK